MGERYLPCGFGGKKEINVLNFVPGLYNFIIVNTCKHKFGGGGASGVKE